MTTGDASAHAPCVGRHQPTPLHPEGQLGEPPGVPKALRLAAAAARKRVRSSGEGRSGTRPRAVPLAA